VRLHLRQLFAQDGLRPKLDVCFLALDEDASGHLHRDAFLRFADGLGGSVHELCESRSRAGLVRPLYSDHAWVAANFEQAFPPETPLNRGRFYEVAQLVMVRRLVRTIIQGWGTTPLHIGFESSVVLGVWLELDGARVHFRSIAPARSNPQSPGHCDGPCGDKNPWGLDAISEAPEDALRKFRGSVWHIMAADALRQSIFDCDLPDSSDCLKL